ncbi:hypothetical protein ROZALSC1DRAFT_24071, partial [Rozella allomycis CSF55]
MTINNLRIASDAVNNHSTIYWIKAHDSSSQYSPDTITNIQIQNSHISDTQTSDLPTLLPLLIGEQYIISSNIAAELNLAKCSRCTLVNIKFPDNTEYVTSNQDCMPSNLPEWIEVELEKNIILSTTWPGVTENDNKTIVLGPLSKSINLPFQIDSKHRQVKLIRKQFPLVPAFAFTIYRAQGQ